jgi:hypothetical protein
VCPRGVLYVHKVSGGEERGQVWWYKVLFLVGAGPPLMGRPAATPEPIQNKPRSAYGQMPKQQGWLHQGLTDGGQSVAEL